MDGMQGRDVGIDKNGILFADQFLTRDHKVLLYG